MPPPLSPTQSFYFCISHILHLGGMLNAKKANARRFDVYIFCDIILHAVLGMTMLFISEAVLGPMNKLHECTEQQHRVPARFMCFCLGLYSVSVLCVYASDLRHEQSVHYICTHLHAYIYIYIYIPSLH
jgi:hypothetical protein